MVRKYIVLSLGFALTGLTVACDHLCSHTVQDVAVIQNMTGRSMTLTFCKGSIYGMADVALPQNSLSHQLSLGSREEKVARGGPGNSGCSDVSDETRKMGITLAPNSFGKVKLCYDSGSDTNVIIEPYQSCPSGFSEQTTAEACRQSST